MAVGSGAVEERGLGRLASSRAVTLQKPVMVSAAERMRALKPA